MINLEFDMDFYLAIINDVTLYRLWTINEYLEDIEFKKKCKENINEVLLQMT